MFQALSDELDREKQKAKVLEAPSKETLQRLTELDEQLANLKTSAEKMRIEGNKKDLMIKQLSEKLKDVSSKMLVIDVKSVMVEPKIEKTQEMEQHKKEMDRV
ncbi:MAG: hypothetical protein EZS28_052705 [Streblomastix strix]|uniref:Uncharacterized protein n=1 Tax=Streblomastix strix TaxID=222440 RepID=A0A5J4RXR5_9EUKA|nr:MAG: hypothetical protein EZS28_052705 [Streblomastix strix]